ncbi:hypothetical protein Tco_1360153 [Tanacetum coccineum]
MNYLRMNYLMYSAELTFPDDDSSELDFITLPIGSITNEIPISTVAFNFPRSSLSFVSKQYQELLPEETTELLENINMPSIFHKVHSVFRQRRSC